MLVLRRRPWLAVSGGVIAILGLVVLGYLVSPLFIRTTLVEQSSASLDRPVASGSFNEIDNIHKGRGQAQIFRNADGRLTVRFEDFSVTNGPDLYVFLSRHANPETDEEVKDGINLGRLKASDGAFEYQTEGPVDPAEFRSVVVHCVAFRTIFSFATLQ